MMLFPKGLMKTFLGIVVVAASLRTPEHKKLQYSTHTCVQDLVTKETALATVCNLV